jgi:hypothetical protein
MHHVESVATEVWNTQARIQPKILTVANSKTAHN